MFTPAVNGRDQIRSWFIAGRKLPFKNATDPVYLDSNSCGWTTLTRAHTHTHKKIYQQINLGEIGSFSANWEGPRIQGYCILGYTLPKSKNMLFVFEARFPEIALVIKPT